MTLNVVNTTVSKTAYNILLAGKTLVYVIFKRALRLESHRARNSGSFIRWSANISCGSSFIQALYSKYIEQLHGSESQEKVLLGSSHGSIEVEAVRLDKIRGKYANLDRLREVSLDNELVATCDPPGTILKTCPSKSHGVG